MPLDTLTPQTPVTVAGTGPYAIPHPYTEGAIRAYVTSGATRTALTAPADFTVSPVATDSAGTLTLSGAAALAHAGKTLTIERHTSEQQGWVAVAGPREAGLAAQLDRTMMRTQELTVGLGRTLRATTALSAFVAQPNTYVAFDLSGQPVLRPLPLTGGDVTVALELQVKAWAETEAAGRAAVADGDVFAVVTAGNFKLRRRVGAEASIILHDVAHVDLDRILPAAAPPAAAIVTAMSTLKTDGVPLKLLVGRDYVAGAAGAGARLNAILPSAVAEGLRIVDPDGMHLGVETQVFTRNDMQFDLPKTTTFERKFAQGAGNKADWAMFRPVDMDVNVARVKWKGGRLIGSQAFPGMMLAGHYDDFEFAEMELSGFHAAQGFLGGGNRGTVTHCRSVSSLQAVGDGAWRWVGGTTNVRMAFCHLECFDDGLQCVPGGRPLANPQFPRETQGIHNVLFVGNTAHSRSARMMIVAIGDTGETNTYLGSITNIRFENNTGTGLKMLSVGCSHKTSLIDRQVDQIRVVGNRYTRIANEANPVGKTVVSVTCPQWGQIGDVVLEDNTADGDQNYGISVNANGARVSTTRDRMTYRANGVRLRKAAEVRTLDTHLVFQAGDLNTGETDPDGPGDVGDGDNSTPGAEGRCGVVVLSTATGTDPGGTTRTGLIEVRGGSVQGIGTDFAVVYAAVGDVHLDGVVATKATGATGTRLAIGPNTANLHIVRVDSPPGPNQIDDMANTGSLRVMSRERRYFRDRAAAVAMVPSLPLGREFQVGDELMVRDGIGSGIPDMAGVSLLPTGRPISVTVFGAKGDGVADDTAAIQAAVNFASQVFFPRTAAYYRITAEINLPTDDQVILSDGAQLRQVTAGQWCFKGIGRTSVKIGGLTLYGNGARSSQTSDGGIYLIDSADCDIRGNEFLNHKGAGVLLLNSEGCAVEGNRFLSAAVPANGTDLDGFADIALLRGARRNTVSGNICKSGQHIAVLVQTTLPTQYCDENVISGNIIKDTKVYGVCLYRNDDSLPIGDESVIRNIVANNVVNGVSGEVANSITATFTYGAGIYVQGAEGTIVAANQVRATHSAPVAFVDLLAPGAIGVTNVTRGSVKDNGIDAAGRRAIDVSGANDLGLATGALLIAENRITGAVLGGITLRDQAKVSIIGNQIDTTGDSAIEIDNATLRHDYVIADNSIANTTGVAAIEADNAGTLTITGNKVNTGTVHGISANGCADFVIGHNLVKGAASRAYQVTSTCSGGVLTGNRAVGTSLEGFRVDAKTHIGPGNHASGCTTEWIGTHAWMRGLQSAAAVNTATTTETDLLLNAGAPLEIPANTLTLVNEHLAVRISGTTANNANAKTLRVYVGSALCATFNLTTSQVSIWDIEILITRASLNAQRVRALFRQSGTTTQQVIATALPAATETAAIPVRVTGQGTANGDIQATMFEVLWRPSE